MTTEIYVDFDPSFDIPVELKNARIYRDPSMQVIDGADTDINIQDETLDEDDSQEDIEEPGDALDTPQSFVVISMTPRTSPEGNQVVDVVIDIEDVPGATDYEVRKTLA